MADDNKLFLARVVKDINIDQYTKSQISFGPDIMDATGRVWTNNGAIIKNSGGKFGGGYLSFIKGSTISAESSDDWNFGSGDFTVDFWVRPRETNAQSILIHRDPGSTFLIKKLDSGNGLLVIIEFDNNERVVKSVDCKLTIEQWNHVALVRRGILFNFYLNGKSICTFNNAASIVSSTGKMFIGPSNVDDSTNPNYDIDGIRISKGIARWSSEFTPPTTLNSVTAGYYSRKDGKWNSLGIPANDSALVDMFRAYGTQDCPTQAQLEEIGKGADRPRRCCWKANVSDELPTVKLKAVPKDKLLLSKNLIKIDSLEGIDNVTIVKTLSGNSEIKFIITTDLSTYKTFNFTSGAWETIDPANLTAVKSGGIDSASLSTITRAQWDILTMEKSGLGFAILLAQEAAADDCKLDLLSITINGEDSWDKAVHGIDYKYGYPKSNLLRVTLLTDGDYKINYSEGAKEI